MNTIKGTEKEPSTINERVRSELSFEWIAKYDNGTQLCQYDDKYNWNAENNTVNSGSGAEYHFGHVDQGRLSEFVLVSRTDSNKTLSVNLKTGLFSLNGKVLEKLIMDGKEISLGLRISEGDIIESSLGSRLKIIYYRRVQRASHLAVQGEQVLAVESSNIRQIFHTIGWEGKVNGKFYKFEAAMTHQGELYILPQETFIPIIEA